MGSPALVVNHAVINRENALHSTGPRTEEGKNVTRFNALRHGLYSPTVVLPTEDRAVYEALGAQLRSEYAPDTDEERALCQVLHDTRWRLDRILTMESTMLLIGTEHNRENVEREFGALEDAVAIPLARNLGFIENAKYFAQLARQESRLQRLWDRTAREIVESIADRRRLAPEKSNPDGFVSQDDGFVSQNDGFVSQNNGFVSQNNRRPPAPAKPTPPQTLPFGFVPVKPEDMPKFTGSLAEFKRRQWLRNNGLLLKKKV